MQTALRPLLAEDSGCARSPPGCRPGSRRVRNTRGCPVAETEPSAASPAPIDRRPTRRETRSRNPEARLVEMKSEYTARSKGWRKAFVRDVEQAAMPARAK